MPGPATLRPGGHAIVIVAAAVTGLLAATDRACAHRFETLHIFCAESGCSDGKSPEGALAFDAQGNLFGTTFYGGKEGCGTIFELHAPQNGARRFEMLHSLCGHGTIKDGVLPISRLVIDVHGNLFGTTFNGGTENSGVAYELSPNADHSRWIYREIHGLCLKGQCKENVSTQSYGLTYAGAAGGAPYDGVSPLYGQNNQTWPWALGNAYALTPSADKRRWDARIIFDFCPGQTDCTDPNFPETPLVADAQGTLYGTSNGGGEQILGTVFALHRNPSGGKWSTSVLHAFCSEGDCSDGRAPSSELLFDGRGALYGTTTAGGQTCIDGVTRCGVLFKLVPGGARPRYRVLHSFCVESGCPDGAEPVGPLVMDSDGAIYGSTSHGGGTVFRFKGTLRTLHAFCTDAACADGQHPEGLTMDAAGNIFGVAPGGGANGGGTVFELVR